MEWSSRRSKNAVSVSFIYGIKNTALKSPCYYMVVKESYYGRWGRRLGYCNTSLTPIPNPPPPPTPTLYCICLFLWCSWLDVDLIAWVPEFPYLLFTLRLWLFLDIFIYLFNRILGCPQSVTEASDQTVRMRILIWFFAGRRTTKIYI